MKDNFIRIGTRGSKLALAQAAETKMCLMKAFPNLEAEIIEIQTTGDQVQDQSLAEIGGKGLFTQEIEDSLFDGRIDIAVHSMKDMPDRLPVGLIIECILEREDPRDAFISLKANSLSELAEGAVVGTSSIRRQSQILARRPDLKIVPYRGNVITRLEKLDRGDVDATLLAVAGLKRVGLPDRITSAIPEEEILPAVAQGAIGIECAEKNIQIREMLAQINHAESYNRVLAERTFLQELGGSCTTPIGALAEIDGDEMCLRTVIASPDGKKVIRAERKGVVGDAEAMGKDAGEELKSKGCDILQWRKQQ